MRTTTGTFCVAIVTLACGFAGCQTTSRTGTSLSSRNVHNSPVAEAGHSEERPGRIVTLEPEIEDIDGGSTWSQLGTKLLNPFAKPKKRIPLPLSPNLADNEDDGGSPGFQ